MRVGPPKNPGTYPSQSLYRATARLDPRVWLRRSGPVETLKPSRARALLSSQPSEIPTQGTTAMLARKAQPQLRPLPGMSIARATNRARMRTYGRIVFVKVGEPAKCGDWSPWVERSKPCADSRCVCYPRSPACRPSSPPQTKRRPTHHRKHAAPR
jgi:hypothetical protein